jgi:hypothetical protein
MTRSSEKYWVAFGCLVALILVSLPIVTTVLFVLGWRNLAGAIWGVFALYCIIATMTGVMRYPPFRF